MKKVFFLVLFFFCSFNFVKADTLDYWHVYYYSIASEIEVAAFTISDEEREINLKIIDFNNLNIVFDYLERV
ncbi:hypothetical protein ACE193_05030 [Bernardetia sp. OM2101]|uniref:hypothetical protein n=1 Tax=Bernardetia sp. OM2101 TaxID=3344876 RepID=UPI0035D06D9E